MQARPAQWSKRSTWQRLRGGGELCQICPTGGERLTEGRNASCEDWQEQKEKTARLMAYEKEIQAAYAEEERRFHIAQEKLVAELGNAQQQEEAAKKAMARSIEILAGLAMDVSKEELPLHTFRDS